MHKQENYNIGTEGARALGALLTSTTSLRVGAHAGLGCLAGGVLASHTWVLGSHCSSSRLACLGAHTPPSWQDLNLAKNHVGVEGARQLALGLGPNTSLTALNLEWCKMRSDGVVHVAAALAENRGLVRLNLARWVLGR